MANLIACGFLRRLQHNLRQGRMRVDGRGNIHNRQPLLDSQGSFSNQFRGMGTDNINGSSLLLTLNINGSSLLLTLKENG